jgi:ACT domain-containing protein
MKKTVISVIGKDGVGIIAKVSAKCSEYHVNILDITQSVLQDMFVMVMMVDITDIRVDFPALKETMNTLGEKIGMVIHVMHEDIFNSMHRI